MWKTIRLVFLSLCLSVVASGVALADTVDINTADAPTLAEQLTGVGDARAQAIVDYRETNGAFASVEALTDVDGVGPSTLENNRDRLTVGDN
ncbi:ComEA family DNA-binding protein [Aquisalimonas sp. 2447]|uniref:ComEA family DNA-binding protein n=1 Tax=Aquisalimonas sp. 2447 TaxID=2740807 RepID=UPI0014327F5E|nr:ComEA family DNA-binding protein [Aquisalimonas sp. 2447]QIT54640.1 ComEA family DNA-binding protein [Aquisalimonas sp. 2447]